MKNLSLILTFSIIFSACEKDYDIPIDYNNIDLDTFIINNYINDARDLYYNEVHNNIWHKNYHNPIIDTSEIYKVLKIIQAVYNNDSPQRDTVFDYYSIHSNYPYNYSSILLRVLTNAPEIENLSRNIIPTGNPSLDKILNEYDFYDTEKSYSYPTSNWLTINTQKKYNPIPIIDELNDIQSIISAEMNEYFLIDGNNISLFRSNNTTRITFSIGMGDCPAGCGYHKYWEFKIMENFAVFTRSYEN